MLQHYYTSLPPQPSQSLYPHSLLPLTKALCRIYNQKSVIKRRYETKLITRMNNILKKGIIHSIIERWLPIKVQKFKIVDSHKSYYNFQQEKNGKVNYFSTCPFPKRRNFKFRPDRRRRSLSSLCCSCWLCLYDLSIMI